MSQKRHGKQDLREAKANPEPAPAISHDYGCTHDPCVCENPRAAVPSEPTTPILREQIRLAVAIALHSVRLVHDGNGVVSGNVQLIIDLIDRELDAIGLAAVEVGPSPALAKLRELADNLEHPIHCKSEEHARAVVEGDEPYAATIPIAQECDCGLDAFIATFDAFIAKSSAVGPSPEQIDAAANAVRDWTDDVATDDEPRLHQIMRAALVAARSVRGTTTESEK